MAYTRVEPGMRYGRLVVVSFYGNTKAGKKIWECKCDCGGVTHTTSGRLNIGHTRSCGCLARESARKCRLAEQKHGAARPGQVTPTYVSWVSMRRRCLSEADKDFKGWGAKGIKIDPRWSDFSVFLSDMGERPPGTTLDRINNDGDYCKENCRWADAKTQTRNSRSAKLTEKDVCEIKNDNRNQYVIAKDYGVSQACVSNIKTGRRWND